MASLKDRINYLGKGVFGCLAFVNLTSCEKSGDLLLYQASIQGNSSVKLIRQVESWDHDDYRLEVCAL